MSSSLRNGRPVVGNSTSLQLNDVLPAGTLLDFAGTSAPSGFLLCYGQVVSQSTYTALYANIGTTYNTGGEGAGNFRLPDSRGRVHAGKDDMGGSAASRITAAGSGITGTTLGASGGTETHTLTTTQMPSHKHTLLGGDGGAGANTTINTTSGAGITTAGTATTHDLSAAMSNTGSGGAHQNTQPTLIVNKIIKY